MPTINFCPLFRFLRTFVLIPEGFGDALNFVGRRNASLADHGPALGEAILTGERGQPFGAISLMPLGSERQRTGALGVGAEGSHVPPAGTEVRAGVPQAALSCGLSGWEPCGIARSEDPFSTSGI